MKATTEMSVFTAKCCHGPIVTVSDEYRSHPADSKVAYVGRVAFSERRRKTNVSLAVSGAVGWVKVSVGRKLTVRFNNGFRRLIIFSSDVACAGDDCC